MTIAIILAPACAVCFGDSVSLRIGATIEGEIVQDDLDGVKIRLASGVEKFYKREEVIRVERERPAALAEADELLKALPQNADEAKIMEVIRRYEDAVKVGENNWVREQGRLRLIQCYQSLGDLKKSVEAYIEILNENPKTAAFAYIPIIEPDDRGKEEALSYLSGVAAGEQEQFIKDVAKLLIADLLMAQGESDKIEPDLKAALEGLSALRVSSDGRIASFIKVRRVRLAFTRGEYDKAIGLAQKGLRSLSDPFLPELYYWLGRSHFEVGDPKRALAALLRAPILYGEFEDLASRCLYLSAQAFERLEQWERAKRTYKELVEKYPWSACARKVRLAEE